jgi:hypothetical protein
VNKIVDYIIIFADNPTQLTCLVKEWMQYGWQPLGAPYIFHSDICQALVAYEKN